MGTCLGSQLIAHAYNAPVYDDERKECGFYRVNLAADGKRSKLFKGFDDQFPVFHWHGEAFDIPEGASALALSNYEDPKVQAFAYRNRLGILFHNEMTPGMITTLLNKDRDWFIHRDNRPYHNNTEYGILQDAFELNSPLSEQARLLFDNFVSTVSSQQVHL